MPLVKNRKGNERYSFAQISAYLVLKILAILRLHHTLVDDAEGKLMAVGSCEIASQRADTSEGAGLGSHVAIGFRFLHAIFQRSVDTRQWQRRHEVFANAVGAPSVAKQTGKEFGRHIIIKGEAGTIGHAIAGRVVAKPLYHLSHGRSSILLRGRTRGSQSVMIEHALGIEVVALLHHARENLVERVGKREESGEFFPHSVLKASSWAERRV